MANKSPLTIHFYQNWSPTSSFLSNFQICMRNPSLLAWKTGEFAHFQDWFLNGSRHRNRKSTQMEFWRTSKRAQDRYTTIDSPYQSFRRIHLKWIDCAHRFPKIGCNSSSSVHKVRRLSFYMALCWSIGLNRYSRELLRYEVSKRRQHGQGVE